MGDHAVTSIGSNAIFAQHLLDDLEALNELLRSDKIEHAPIRIGAEQEFCLVNPQWRPSKNALSVLKAINDPHFTTELAQYNLEINLDPVPLGGQSFTSMEASLRAYLEKVTACAEVYGDRIVLSGILPTITKREVDLDYITDHPRYWLLNETMKKVRGSDFTLSIKGVDELRVRHDSVMFEACNTSFQTHLQVDPDDFIASYNWAQTIAGPILSVCVNSPLLMGRELWSETRIAIFQQSIDTRSSNFALSDQLPRVAFGRDWEKGNILDIYKNDIAQYPVLLHRPIETSSTEQLAKGDMPKLTALNLFNGTVYRWNRACFGSHNGKAHVRIENRYLPAGPTVTDQMANFCFWVGLMYGRPSACADMSSQMPFQSVKSNFIKASRTGLETVMEWMGEEIPARELIQKCLIPMAADGLQKAGVSMEESQHYLDIIKQRAAGQTGASWCVKNYRNLRKSQSQDDALIGLTKAIHYNQKTGNPVHTWSELYSPGTIHEHAEQVGHIMSTQLLTVRENDLAALALKIMEWKNIHHLPVENDEHQLTGILTWKHVHRSDIPEGAEVVEIMTSPVISAPSDLPIKEALSIMRKEEIGCLPVLERGHLIGIVTIRDLIIHDHAEGI